MRYDSDPQVVRRILTEADGLYDALEHPLSTESIPPGLFDELAHATTSFLSTLDHFITLHTLNPQFSLSRFSAQYIEKKLAVVWDAISKIFRHKEFDTVEEQVKWNLSRFVNPQPPEDNEQALVTLYKKIAQVLDVYYAERVRNTHVAAILNEFVGWAEHIDTHGHHDIHGVIIFAEKVARDNAVITHRVEVVREICGLVEERSFLQPSQRGHERHTAAVHTAQGLCRIYSPHLLELYGALLEDMEIIAIANTDYQAFERYCQDNEIDIYEEYHAVLQNYFQEYTESIDSNVTDALELVKTANLLLNADTVHIRYQDFALPEEVVGENLSHAIAILERAVRTLKHTYPDRAEDYQNTLRKVRRFKGEIVKPAIRVYGEYLHSQQTFFENLFQNHTTWIPILDSALACLDQHEDLYQKCRKLRKDIDEFIASH